MDEKLTKMAEFYDSCLKMTEFYITIARKIFSSFWWPGGGARALPAPCLKPVPGVTQNLHQNIVAHSSEASENVTKGQVCDSELTISS